MANTKYSITKAQALDYAINFIKENGGDVEYADRLDVLLTQATTKRATVESETARRNKELVVEVLNVLRDADTALTAKQIFERTDHPEIGSAQKVTALLRMAIANGQVSKITPDKKSAPMTYTVA